MQGLVWSRNDETRPCRPSGSVTRRVCRACVPRHGCCCSCLATCLASVPGQVAAGHSRGVPAAGWGRLPATGTGSKGRRAGQFSNPAQPRAGQFSNPAGWHSQGSAPAKAGTPRQENKVVAHTYDIRGGWARTNNLRVINPTLKPIKLHYVTGLFIV